MKRRVLMGVALGDYVVDNFLLPREDGDEGNDEGGD